MILNPILVIKACQLEDQSIWIPVIREVIDLISVCVVHLCIFAASLRHTGFRIIMMAISIRAGSRIGGGGGGKDDKQDEEEETDDVVGHFIIVMENVTLLCVYQTCYKSSILTTG